MLKTNKENSIGRYRNNEVYTPIKWRKRRVLKWRYEKNSKSNEKWIENTEKKNSKTWDGIDVKKVHAHKKFKKKRNL